MTQLRNHQALAIPLHPLQAPSSSSSAPTLDDLGSPRTRCTETNRTQTLLDKRCHMLKVHTVGSACRNMSGRIS